MYIIIIIIIIIIKFTTVSQICQMFSLYISISRTIFKLYGTQTWHDDIRGIYARSRFDYLDLDAWSQRVAEGKKSVLNYFDN